MNALSGRAKDLWFSRNFADDGPTIAHVRTSLVPQVEFDIQQLMLLNKDGVLDAIIEDQRELLDNYLGRLQALGA